MISVHEAEKLSLEQMPEFLSASTSLRFEARRGEVHGWIERVLCQHEYSKQKKKAKGVLLRYLQKMSGRSRAQVARLVSRFVATGRVQVARDRRHHFPKRYTRADIELLAAVDEAHQTLSGPATRRILQREFQVYGQREFARLAGISNGHLYNLRHSTRYRETYRSYQKTRPTPVAIGERRKPNPQGRPGYLRVDTVHQGDAENGQGVYHLNAVDEVTQWEVAAAVPRISEAFLEPALAAMIEQFPFRIHGFHSDNGSEFINQTVAKLLNKLMIEQTKSRPRRSNDNALAETKNGAILRKHLGWGAIDAGHATRLRQFYAAHCNPYLNYHRPCAQAEVRIDERGRKHTRYPHYQTPCEKLLSLENPQQYLRPELTVADLENLSSAMSDTAAARRMQQAKHQLFEQLRNPA